MSRKPRDLAELTAELTELTHALASAEASKLSSYKTRKLRETIRLAYEELRQVVERLDPVKHPGVVFDPGNPSVAGRIAGITMIAQPRKPLSGVDKFYGSGVYAVYYNGEFPAYAAIANKEHPIYVGKADPENPAAKTAQEQGDRLANRLNDHRKNILKASSTLNIEDFDYRALVVQTGWQASAEEYLIHLFKPIWNVEIGICYGFGKHGDAPTTRLNLRSPWDTLHPGRDWAHRDPKMKDARAESRIRADIREHLSKNPPLETVDDILKKFLEEMSVAT